MILFLLLLLRRHRRLLRFLSHIMMMVLRTYVVVVMLIFFFQDGHVGRKRDEIEREERRLSDGGFGEGLSPRGGTDEALKGEPHVIQPPKSREEKRAVEGGPDQREARTSPEVQDRVGLTSRTRDSSRTDGGAPREAATLGGLVKGRGATEEVVRWSGGQVTGWKGGGRRGE